VGALCQRVSEMIGAAPSCSATSNRFGRRPRPAACLPGCGRAERGSKSRLHSVSGLLEIRLARSRFAPALPARDAICYAAAEALARMKDVASLPLAAPPPRARFHRARSVCAPM